jgi:hypothetical protein
VGSKGFATDMVEPTSEMPSTSGDGTGAFRTVCEFSHMAFDDPIVYPGQPGKSHLHVFFGNTGTNAGSTPASIASTGNSTCRGGTINRSGYWVPAIVDTLDGTPVTPQSMIIYYKTGYNGVKPADIKSLPQGLRMIAGDSRNSGPYQWGGPAHFTCIEPVTGTGPSTQNLPIDVPDRQHDLGRGRVPAVLGRGQSRFAGPQEPHVVPGERRLPGIAPGRGSRDHRQRPLSGRRHEGVGALAHGLGQLRSEHPSRLLVARGLVQRLEAASHGRLRPELRAAAEGLPRPPSRERPEDAGRGRLDCRAESRVAERDATA